MSSFTILDTKKIDNPYHLIVTPLVMGRLRGTVYTFKKIGAVLPMHRHTAIDVHITIIAKGRMRIHGSEIGDKEYEEGTVMDWDVGVDHEFISLTEGAKLVHILKNTIGEIT